ncbi:MAG: C69 family dipeptidase [Prevotella sp.]|nr:C69 family dipeptidase [Prevotella sp.]
MKDLNRRFFPLAVIVLTSVFANAQSVPDDIDARGACTSIAVGRKASADGSIITSHTCDGDCRTWMNFVQAQDHKAGEMEPVFQGRMWTQAFGDSTKVYKKGEIPQVAHTYRYLDTAYPCINEKQLGIGETTIFGREMLKNPDGMLYIEELERIVLERCTTARDAIRLIDHLTKTYGYADTGECLTIADKNEVWFFEIFGEGRDRKGAVWAAVRVPDDEVAVSANIPRIGHIDVKDTENYMASANIFDVAKRLKLWDGKEEFCMWKVYGGTNLEKKEKNYDTREYFILSTLAPSLNLNDKGESLPLSVKPEKKLSVEDVSRLLGSYYEGTSLSMADRHKIPNPKKKDKEGNIVENEPDSITSPVSNPWMRKDEVAMYNNMGDKGAMNTRTVSMPWCAYSTVVQLRSWLPDEVGGVVWVSFDNPGESPRIPIFAGCTEVPRMFLFCGQRNNRKDSAISLFREANRLATVRWGEFRNTLEPARDYFWQKADREIPFVESSWKELNSKDPKEAEKMLNGYTADFFAATIMKWNDMAQWFWYKTLWGF